MHDQKVIVYRLGGISIERLEQELAYVPEVKNELHHGVRTSGMVKYHYATETPLYFLTEESRIFTLNEGRILFQCNERSYTENDFCLSASGDMEEAAKNLYAALHDMDSRGFDCIFIEPFPNEGLGKTMNDRLKRATAKFQD
jgi:L-threonylcarbamoyladenylate synthase